MAVELMNTFWVGGPLWIQLGRCHILRNPVSFFELVIGVLDPEHKFVKGVGAEKMKIEYIIQLQEGDTEEK